MDTRAYPRASGPDIELGTAALRVLAHPMRINVLALLRQCGPSTATRVAGELGINSGAASYHLRRLAAGGLIAHAVALACVERLHTVAQEVPLLPEEWFDVSTFGDFVLRLSPKEVARMRGEIFAVISRYRQGQGQDSEGVAPVAVQVQMFPVPGTIALRSVGS